MRWMTVVTMAFGLALWPKIAPAETPVLNGVEVTHGNPVPGFRSVGLTRIERRAQPLGAQYWNTAAKELFGDAPWITRSGVFPVVFVVKDASQNPICNLTVSVYQHVGPARYPVQTVPVGSVNFDQFYLTGGFSLSNLPVAVNAPGDTALIEWEATYQDNLCFSAHVSRYYNRITRGQPLPELANWYRTDTHYHSRFTDNLFEFGGMLWMVRYAAEVVGLRAVCLTDHSTDIRTTANEFGWQQLLAEADAYTDDLVVLIPGEELTVDSNESNDFPDNRIHLLAAGLTRPLLAPEECCSENSSPQLWTLRQALDSVSVQGGVALAAHPSATFGVGYGGELTRWSDTNFDIAGTYPVFVGAESFNERRTVLDRSIPNDDEVYGYDWVPNSAWPDAWNASLADFCAQVRRSLDPLRPLALAGGSDAHGDFGRKYTNRYGITGRVVNDNAIGKVHTLVYSPAGLSRNGILDGMRNRQMVMTDGPAMTVWVDGDGNGTNDGTVGGQFALAPEAVLRLDGGCLAAEHGQFSEARVIHLTPAGIDTMAYVLSGTTLNAVLPAGQYPVATWSALIVQVMTQNGYQAVGSPIYVAPQGSTAVDPAGSVFRFTVGPNPGRTVWFDVNLPAAGCATVDLYDVRGRLVDRVLDGCGQSEYRIRYRTRTSASGVYFARLAVDGRPIGVRKVVIFE